MSDNGGQFSGHKFQEFAKEWNFTHLTSSPEYPQSNGLAENAVKQAKSLLEKTRRDGSDIYQNLLNIRNIPRDKILGSPAQRLMSRATRNPVFTNQKLLKPAPRQTKIVKAQLYKKRNQQKKTYDKHARPLEPLKVNQTVRIQTPKGYDRLGKVTQVLQKPRSYMVQTGTTRIRRNRKHLLPIQEEIPQPSQTVHIPNEPAQAQQVPAQPAKVQQAPPVQLQNIPSQRHTAQARVAVQGSPPTQTPPTQIQTPQPTKTRSGRVVRPNPKYSDQVFERT